MCCASSVRSCFCNLFLVNHQNKGSSPSDTLGPGPKGHVDGGNGGSGGGGGGVDASIKTVHV